MLYSLIKYFQLFKQLKDNRDYILKFTIYVKLFCTPLNKEMSSEQGKKLSLSLSSRRCFKEETSRVGKKKVKIASFKPDRLPFR